MRPVLNLSLLIRRGNPGFPDVLADRALKKRTHQEHHLPL